MNELMASPDTGDTGDTGLLVDVPPNLVPYVHLVAAAAHFRELLQKPPRRAVTTSREEVVDQTEAARSARRLRRCLARAARGVAAEECALVLKNSALPGEGSAGIGDFGDGSCDYVTTRKAAAGTRSVFDAEANGKWLAERRKERLQRENEGVYDTSRKRFSGPKTQKGNNQTP